MVAEEVLPVIDEDPEELKNLQAKSWNVSTIPISSIT